MDTLLLSDFISFSVWSSGLLCGESLGVVSRVISLLGLLVPVEAFIGVFSLWIVESDFPFRFTLGFHYLSLGSSKNCGLFYLNSSRCGIFLVFIWG